MFREEGRQRDLPGWISLDPGAARLGGQTWAQTEVKKRNRGTLSLAALVFKCRDKQRNPPVKSHSITRGATNFVYPIN